MDKVTLGVIVILFGATLIRAILGFGEALVAVPLLALVMPVQQAAPIAVLVSIAIAILILARDWRRVQFKSAAWLIVSTFFGIPFGLYLLTTLPEALVKSILAVLIITFSVHPFLRRRQYALKNDRLAWLFGFHAGVLGGAYGMNGPPLAIYGSLRNWRPDEFRATLQAYFLPASVAGMGGYWVAGLWTPAVSHFFVISLPAVILATVFGHVISRRLQPHRFTVYVYAGLIVTGSVLLLQSLRAATAS